MAPDSSSVDVQQLQIALQESEARRRVLLDSALDCVICADGEVRITEFNAAAERTFRVAQSETLGKDLADIILPRSLRDRLRRELFTSASASGIDVIGNRLETKCQRYDGSEFPAEITVTQIIIKKESSYTVYVRDITARRIAEETLVRLAAIVESSQDAIIGKDLSGRITSWNKGAEFIYGYSAKEVIGRKISFLAPLDRTDEIPEILQELKNGRGVQNYETVRVGKNKKLIDVSLTVSPVLDSEGNIVGASAIERDISERKQAEEALRKANETSIYSSPVPIVVADSDRRITMWNPAAEDLFGWRENEVIAKLNPTIPADGQDAASNLHAKLLSGQIVTGLEVVREKRDGTRVTMNLSAAAIRGADRKVKGIIGFLIDVSARKRAELGLREAEQKYRTIFENAVEGIYQTTPEGRYLSANPSLAEMLGFDSPEDLITSRTDIKTQEYVNAERRAEFLDLMEKHGEVRNFEYQVYRKDKKIIWISENAHAVRGTSGDICYFEGTVQDTTRHRELEQQLRQMQKIEAVGRLAGGVAHDFNNVLMAISSYAELLERKLHDDAAKRYAGEIAKATERGSSLTQGLLTFSRKQVVSPKVLDVNAILNDQLKMLSRLVPENIELKFVRDEKIGRIKADPSQVEQVFMNLVINARDAMPDGGRIVIETGSAILDPNDATGPKQAREYVMVAVSDTGCGMSPETKSKIFEPFFTTKEQGKGTGLGLAIVFGIVKQSGGQIFVHSEPGQGASFKVYFPLVEGIVQEERSDRQESSLKGYETILLVEDEEGVRESTAEYLAENGYTVLKAKNGPEALAIAERNRQPIALLLTDVIMPQMSGPELSEKISTLHPSIRVVFMSGYTSNLLSNQQVLDPKHVLLHKPFRLAALSSLLREVLGQAKSTSAGT